jgi:hypothetical protein
MEDNDVEENSYEYEDEDESFFEKKIIELIKSLKSLFVAFSKYVVANITIPQIIQLSFIYFFALIDLMYSILSNVYALGYEPEMFSELYPLIMSILTSPILQFWASPEKVFFLSYMVLEFMVVRSIFKFSKLVRYNILLLFSVLMIQGLVISYWDVLFHRDVTSAVINWTYDEGAFISTNRNFAIFFFLNTFTTFLGLYIYLYIQAIRGKFATLPFAYFITDSVAFWLRIKTPTMRFGKRKK